MKENQGADIWYIELKLCGESMLHNHFQRLVISIQVNHVSSGIYAVDKSFKKMALLSLPKKRKKRKCLIHINLTYYQWKHGVLTLLILHFKVGF